MGLRKLRAVVCCALLVAACSSGDDDATTSSSRQVVDAAGADSTRLYATLASGMGPLGQRAPRIQFIWISPEGAPSISYRP